MEATLRQRARHHARQLRRSAALLLPCPGQGEPSRQVQPARAAGRVGPPAVAGQGHHRRDDHRPHLDRAPTARRPLPDRKTGGGQGLPAKRQKCLFRPLRCALRNLVRPG